MSKSIDFCKQRAKESDFDFLPDAQFNEVNSLNIIKEVLDIMFRCDTKEFVSTITKGGIEFASTNDDNKSRKVKVMYEPEADFDYFTSSRNVNDGTLLFALENIHNVIYHVVCGNTYCKTKVSKEYLDNLDKYAFIYTIGDIVIATEHSKEFSTEEKPWMTQRDTAMLPIKFDMELDRRILV